MATPRKPARLPLWSARVEGPFRHDLSPEDELVLPPGLAELISHSVYEGPDRKSLAVDLFAARKPTRREAAALARALSGFLHRAVAPPVFKSLGIKDWVRESEKALKAVTAGRFFIHGSHVRNKVSKGKVAIRIDAALAFGTGYHESTRCCLRALDARAGAPAPKNALDLGCGSGILALAMTKIWPDAKVTASDIDEVAITVARENAAKNAAGNLAFAVAEGFDHPILKGRTFDVITANILAGPLIALAPAIAAHLARHGMVILSGLTADQKDGVLGAYLTQGLAFEREFSENAWVALVLRNA